MTVGDQVLIQAQELTGAYEGKENTLLSALCQCAVSSLGTRLKEGLYPEDCGEAFVMAAAFHAAAAFGSASQEGVIQEFRAGDLTVKHSPSSEAGIFAALVPQAERMMKPYLKDGFCFSGV